jgi:hypothetical protein
MVWDGLKEEKTLHFNGGRELKSTKHYLLSQEVMDWSSLPIHDEISVD